MQTPIATHHNLTNLKDIRFRLGWTQQDLAEHLGVDQGTVSRWERGVEKPRPSTYASIRDLIIRDEHKLALKRQLSMIRNDFAPITLMDHEHRLQEFSEQGKQHYRQRYGIDIAEQKGWDLARHTNHFKVPAYWEAIQKAKLGKDRAILQLRVVMNIYGHAHVTSIEPLYEGGQFLGWTAMRMKTFELPSNDEASLESLDAIYADDISRPENIYRGMRADICEAMLRAAD